jgi:hypothetical protein
MMYVFFAMYMFFPRDMEWVWVILMFAAFVIAVRYRTLSKEMVTVIIGTTGLLADRICILYLSYEIWGTPTPHMTFRYGIVIAEDLLPVCFGVLLFGLARTFADIHSKIVAIDRLAHLQVPTDQFARVPVPPDSFVEARQPQSPP